MARVSLIDEKNHPELSDLTGKLRGAEIEFSAGGQKYTGTVSGNTIKGQGWTATKK